MSTFSQLIKYTIDSVCIYLLSLNSSVLCGYHLVPQYLTFCLGYVFKKTSKRKSRRNYDYSWRFKISHCPTNKFWLYLHILSKLISVSAEFESETNSDFNQIVFTFLPAGKALFSNHKLSENAFTRVLLLKDTVARMRCIFHLFYHYQYGVNDFLMSLLMKFILAIYF